MIYIEITGILKTLMPLDHQTVKILWVLDADTTITHFWEVSIKKKRKIELFLNKIFHYYFQIKICFHLATHSYRNLSRHAKQYFYGDKQLEVKKSLKKY